MKKFLVITLLSVAFGFGTAYAGPLTEFDLASSAGNFTASDVFELDWASTGSGLAEGIVPGQPLNLNDTFTFDYQAKLTGLSDIDGDPIFGFLSSTFEYTIVARFLEKVTEATTGAVGDAAQFTTVSGTFAIFYDDFTAGVAAEVATGLGFDDGIAVMEGTINSGSNSTFTLTSNPPPVGNGSANALEGIITSLNENYIKSSDDALTLFDFEFQGTQNYPAGNSTTTDFFASAGPLESLYPTVSVPDNALLLKADGSNNISVVPEPSTMILLGIGLVGLVGCGRKRMVK